MLIPVVDTNFVATELEGLPDDIRELSRQLLVPVQWDDEGVQQGLATVRDCVRHVASHQIKPELKEYLRDVV